MQGGFQAKTGHFATCLVSSVPEAVRRLGYGRTIQLPVPPGDHECKDAPKLYMQRCHQPMMTVLYAAGRRKAGLLRNRAAAAAAAAALPGGIPGVAALDGAVPLGEMPLAAPFMGAPPSLPPLKSARGGRANGKGYGARAMRGGKATASVDTTSNITPGKEAPPGGMPVCAACKPSANGLSFQLLPVHTASHVSGFTTCLIPAAMWTHIHVCTSLA